MNRAILAKPRGDPFAPILRNSSGMCVFRHFFNSEGMFFFAARF